MKNQDMYGPEIAMNRAGGMLIEAHWWHCQAVSDNSTDGVSKG